MAPPSRHCSLSSALKDSFFENTSRRWIFNENDQLKERYVKFDPMALQRVAGKAIGREQCSHVKKIAEGGFNKVFLLTTDDGHEVIARIPTPIAGPPLYTTASELATIDFLRTVLGLPVPKILDYSTSSKNSVGAEYIIMERVHGESLASRWLSLTTDEVKYVMTQIVEMEQKIFSFQFPGHGSLYYKRDLNDESQIALQVEGFCIGPIARRQFWHAERHQMELDRGPWHSPEDCSTSAARREIACSLDHAKPQPRQTFLLPTSHNIEPSEHISLLSKHLQLAPYLIPKGFSAPTLRHPDLSLGNIYLVPGSAEIASVIDWQDAIIFPLYMQAGCPDFCEHDSSYPQSLQLPTLPEDYNHMNMEEQLEAKAKFRLEEANLYYTAATGIQNGKHMESLKIPHLRMRQYLFQQTGYPWDADLINLRAALVGITSTTVWDYISPFTCPVSFPDSERDKAMEESQSWNESEALLSTIRGHLKIDLEGGTEPENFEWAFHRNLEFRLEMLRQTEEHERDICWRNWPYKDDDDDSSPPPLDEDSGERAVGQRSCQVEPSCDLAQ